MPRILHVSDTHLGKWQYNNDQRKQDYADAFEQSIDIALEEEVDAVIHTGDLYDDPSPGSSTIEQSVRIIKKLEEKNIPFYAIVGNHERKRKAQWMDVISSLEIAERLGKEPTYVGDIAIYGVDAVRRNTWKAMDNFDLPEADDKAEHTLVCMHELIHPPVPEHIYEQSPRVYSAEEALDRIEIDVDAIALGDYHERVRAQEDGVELFYPGSTEKTAKDESTNHSVDILEFDNGTLKRDQKYLDTREFMTIEITVIDGMTSSDLEDKISEYDVEDVVLEVKLSGSNEAAFTKQQIRSAGVRHGALLVNINDTREREGGIPSAEDLDHDITDIETAVDDSIEELSLSDTAKEVEEIVRDTEDVTTDSEIRDKADAIIESSAPEVGGDNE